MVNRPRRRPCQPDPMSAWIHRPNLEDRRTCPHNALGKHLPVNEPLIEIENWVLSAHKACSYQQHIWNLVSQSNARPRDENDERTSAMEITASPNTGNQRRHAGHCWTAAKVKGASRYMIPWVWTSNRGGVKIWFWYVSPTRAELLMRAMSESLVENGVWVF